MSKYDKELRKILLNDQVIRRKSKRVPKVEWVENKDKPVKNKQKKKPKGKLNLKTSKFSLKRRKKKPATKKRK